MAFTQRIRARGFNHNTGGIAMAAHLLQQALRTVACAAPLIFTAGLAQAVSVVVPGTSNPWLAGMPDGTQAISADSAPAHSPVLVTGLNLSLGGALKFTNASGGVSHTGSCPSGCDPIDGSSLFNHSGGAEHGISALRAPINALLGVFLGPDQPDLSPAPAGLDFSPAPANIGLNFATLSPLLKQVFFIGDGQTDAALVQQFDIPSGATRLSLGTHDGFGWFNNNGAITVDVDFAAPIPEPSSAAMWLAGLAGIVLLGRGSRRAAGSAAAGSV
jgi:hypothetical protein